MKRKLSLIVLALVITAALAAPAFADIMWEPYGNSFYEQHRDECNYENRGCQANGPEGYVTLQTAPGSLTEVMNVANGTQLYLGFTWQDRDGSQWGVVEYSVEKEDGGWDWIDGWVPMDQIALIYNHTSFEEDHGAEFQEYDGSGDALTEAYLYSYPGGVCEDFTIEESGSYTFAEAFQYLYTDENGLRWAFTTYYYGFRNYWVCIDDPMNRELGVDAPLTEAQVRGTDDSALVQPAENVPAARTAALWAIPAALVVIAAAVTALIVRSRRKKAG